MLYGENYDDLDSKVAASQHHKLGYENLYILEGGLRASFDTLDTNQLVS